MSAKKRCFTYCNDCPNGTKSPWKIVEADSQDAEWYNLRKEPCVPCRPKHDEKKNEKYDEKKNARKHK